MLDTSFFTASDSLYVRWDQHSLYLGWVKFHLSILTLGNDGFAMWPVALVIGALAENLIDGFRHEIVYERRINTSLQVNGIKEQSNRGKDNRELSEILNPTRYTAPLIVKNLRQNISFLRGIHLQILQMKSKLPNIRMVFFETTERVSSLTLSGTTSSVQCPVATAAVSPI